MHNTHAINTPRDIYVHANDCVLRCTLEMDKLKLSQNSALLCSHWISPQSHPLLWGDFMLTRTSGSKWNQLNRFTLWKEYTSTSPAPALIKHKLMCLLWNCLFWWLPFGKYFREDISLKKALLEGNLSKIPITCHSEIIFSEFWNQMKKSAHPRNDFEDLTTPSSFCCKLWPLQAKRREMVQI